jgi:glutathione S-transferase
MTFELHYSPGSCARVVLVALEEIDQPFVLHSVAFLAGDNRQPEFLALNPSGKVPVLIVDGVPLVQNMAILTYLSDRFPEAGLLPEAKNLFERAKALGDLACFASDLHPLVTRIAFPTKVVADIGCATLLRDAAIERMAGFLKIYEDRLASQPWLLGDQWSIADVYLNWVWFRITGGGFDATPYPNIGAHAERLEQRPSFIRAMAHEAKAADDLRARSLLPKPGL